MKFEEIIKKISATIPSIVVFLLAAGMYLSFKGFVLNENGEPVLMQTANAKEQVEGKIKDDIAITLPKNHVLGKKNAPLAIYEYSSFGCSHCQDFHIDTLPKIKKHFVDTGKVKVIFADFPLDKKSLQASLIARCIPEDKYYDFATLLFKEQWSWSHSRSTEKVLIGYATLNGLTQEQAENCLKSDETNKELIDIRQQGIEKLKIQGTPAFLFVKGNDREVIYGAKSYDDFKKIIEEKLASPLTTK